MVKKAKESELAVLLSKRLPTESNIRGITFLKITVSVLDKLNIIRIMYLKVTLSVPR